MIRFARSRVDGITYEIQWTVNRDAHTGGSIQYLRSYRKLHSSEWVTTISDELAGKLWDGIQNVQ